MSWIDILSTIFGAGGILGFISYFLFFRENKRLKAAEATRDELANMQKSIEILQSQVKYQGEEILRLQKQLGSKNELIQQLYTERDILEKKYAQKKSAVNAAIGCENSNICPVLIKVKEFEDEYFNSNNKRK